MMRYNLIEQRLLGPRAANAVSVALPWVVSVLLYCGTGFTDLVNFAGTFTSSIVNLIVPSALFIASQQLRSSWRSAGRLARRPPAWSETAPGCSGVLGTAQLG
mmetsp:Transcript_71449/g.220899  ORF Transcript_71449/g.220899 Transcript_71449/m.220899 type:complete len:103 (-) Transcript_71449:283-591(-)